MKMTNIYDQGKIKIIKTGKMWGALLILEEVMAVTCFVALIVIALYIL